MDNRTHQKIVVQHLVRDNRTHRRIAVQRLVRDSRTRLRIVVQRLVRDSRTHQRIDRHNQIDQRLVAQSPVLALLKTIATCPARVLLTMVFPIMAGLITTLPAGKTKWRLVPALRIIGLFSRRIATLRQTTVVLDSKFHVRRLPISNRSRSLGSIQGRVLRTTVLRKRRR